jgi:poly(3-hydroxybutyrate) depolymerase
VRQLGARSWRAGVAFTFTVALPATSSLAAALQPIEDFGANPGQLSMYTYVPDERDPNPAMVVALHGCEQRAADFDDETGLIGLADALKFVLVFPEQRETNNDKRCFNWFQRQDNQRDKGETGSIRSMIGYAIGSYHVDPSKIFVLGLSAGGSMTAVLLATYPELFQGGAIIAGTPYQCNNPTFLTWPAWWSLDTWYGDAAAATYACGLFGAAPTQRSAQEWGNYVRSAPQAAPLRWPRVSLWQGDADDVVNPANQVELLKQWTNVHGIDQTPDDTQAVNNLRHKTYRDAHGTSLIEAYEITDLSHALAVDPGTGPERCGVIAPYVKDADICSTLQILKFWGVAP